MGYLEAAENERTDVFALHWPDQGYVLEKTVNIEARIFKGVLHAISDFLHIEC